MDLLEPQLSRTSFQTLIKGTTVRVEGNTWIISAPNHFSRDWIETRYMMILKETISRVTNEVPNVKVITYENSPQFPPQDGKVESILEQIECLSFKERQQVFSTLKKRMNTKHSSIY